MTIGSYMLTSALCLFATVMVMVSIANINLCIRCNAVRMSDLCAIAFNLGVASLLIYFATKI